MMTFPASGGGADFTRVPSGSHIAICNLLVDCGLHPYSSADPKLTHKIYIRFEIPAERITYEKDGQSVEGPLTIGSFYTASMHEKATLRKHLEGWRGRKFTDAEAEVFDVGSILGKGCMLSVVETERGNKTYSNIASIGSLPKGLPTLKAENPLLYYDANTPPEALDRLPKWLHEKVLAQQAPRTETTVDDQRAAAFADDDIPFN